MDFKISLLPKAISYNYVSVGTPFSDAGNVILSLTFEYINLASDEPLPLDELDEKDNYLYPERDYELIHSLRQCIMKKDPEEISVIIEDFQQQNIH